jgi:hypothetical protein
MILLEPITFHIINIIWQLASNTSITLLLFHREEQITPQKHSKNPPDEFNHFARHDARSLHNSLKLKLNAGIRHSLQNLLSIKSYRFAIS